MLGYILGFILAGGILLLLFRKRGGCCGGTKDEFKIKEGGENKMGEKAKDPVCGMEVDKEMAAATSTHMGETFYFCSTNCKADFDQAPMKYMKKEKKSGGCCG